MSDGGGAVFGSFAVASLAWTPGVICGLIVAHSDRFASFFFLLLEISFI